MQKENDCSLKRKAVFSFCCITVLCCLMLSSCLSIPGEKEMEEKKLAADYYDLAIGYVDVKKYDKAITCFEKAREKASSQDIIKIDYQIARTYALSNKWDKACEMYNDLLLVDPANASLKEAYAYSLYKKGDKEKALQIYDELSELYPDNEQISKNYEELKKEKEPPVEEAPLEESAEDSVEAESSDSVENAEVIPGVSA